MAFIRILLLVSSFYYFLLSSNRNGVFSSEAMMKLEHLRTAVDAFLDFLGVTPGTREERL
jgi:hypothetical protein